MRIMLQWFVVALFLLFCFVLYLRAEKPQLTVAVYDRPSIKGVKLTEKSTFECLTKSDGRPDMKQCTLTHYVVDLSGDFRYEIR